MSDEVLPADMCPIGPGAARAIAHAKLVREGKDCGCDPGYHDEEIKMPNSRFDPDSLTVRQFLAIPQGERPTMMDAEVLWNRIKEFKEKLKFIEAEKDLAVGALNEAIQAAGKEALFGHHAYVTAVANFEHRQNLVKEILKVRNA